MANKIMHISSESACVVIGTYSIDDTWYVGTCIE